MYVYHECHMTSLLILHLKTTPMSIVTIPFKNSFMHLYNMQTQNVKRLRNELVMFYFKLITAFTFANIAQTKLIGESLKE